MGSVIWTTRGPVTGFLKWAKMTVSEVGHVYGNAALDMPHIICRERPNGPMEVSFLNWATIVLTLKRTTIAFFEIHENHEDVEKS